VIEPDDPALPPDDHDGEPVNSAEVTPESAFLASEPSEPPSNVLPLDAAKKRRSKASTDPKSEHAPPSPDSASAPSKGKGGEAAGDGGKPKKKVDWGKYTRLIENFTLIYPTDTAWDGEKRKIVKLANMAHMYGADYVRMWKASPDRKSIDEEQLVFDPTEQCGKDAINLWDGLGIEPVACSSSDVEPMLALLDHLCSRCDGAVTSVDEVKNWVLSWLALPLQKQGAKMATALVFHGPQGTGKNLFFDAVRDMYGRYGVMVGQTEIEEKYNAWVSAKQLVVCNEVVSRQELFHNKNRLKWMIDAERIPIRSMHTDTRWEQNWANLVFLSNEKMPIALEQGDRRHLVVYTPVPEDAGLYDRVRAFLVAGGAAKWMHYLLSYPLDGFHEHTKPLMTQAKQDLIELSMEPGERFMLDWMNGYLHLPKTVCSAEQLYRAFRRWGENTGERWAPNQAQFTSTVKKWSDEKIEKDSEGRRLDPVLTYKVINTVDATSSRKAVRCWIPRGCGPRNGVSEGEWAGSAVDTFDAALSRFLRTREGGSGSDEPVSPAPSSGRKAGGER
jgi:putative DNA primase/helicase